MEYVSLELMDILIQNGYNHSSKNTSNTASWYQVINWIFRFDDPADEYERQFINNNLEFWYNTLIPELIDIQYMEYTDNNNNEKGYSIEIENKFVLEGFIGMLLNWFLSNNIHITITSISQESWQYHITKPGDSLGKLYDEDFYTKQQARHEVILMCFELMKGK